MENLHSKFALLVNAVNNKMGWQDISQLAKDLYTSANRYLLEHRFGGKIKDNLSNISTQAQRIWSLSSQTGNDKSLSAERREEVLKEIYQYLRNIQAEFKAIEGELKIGLREILS